MRCRKTKLKRFDNRRKINMNSAGAYVRKGRDLATVASGVEKKSNGDTATALGALD